MCPLSGWDAVGWPVFPGGMADGDEGDGLDMLWNPQQRFDLPFIAQVQGGEHGPEPKPVGR
jgi:hypothetical protein